MGSSCSLDDSTTNNDDLMAFDDSRHEAPAQIIITKKTSLTTSVSNSSAGGSPHDHHGSPQIPEHCVKDSHVTSPVVQMPPVEEVIAGQPSPLNAVDTPNYTRPATAAGEFGSLCIPTSSAQQNTQSPLRMKSIGMLILPRSFSTNSYSPHNTTFERSVTQGTTSLSTARVDAITLMEATNGRSSEMVFDASSSSKLPHRSSLDFLEVPNPLATRDAGSDHTSSSSSSSVPQQDEQFRKLTASTELDEEAPLSPDTTAALMSRAQYAMTNYRNGRATTQSPSQQGAASDKDGEGPVNYSASELPSVSEIGSGESSGAFQFLPPETTSSFFDIEEWLSAADAEDEVHANSLLQKRKRYVRSEQGNIITTPTVIASMSRGCVLCSAVEAKRAAAGVGARVTTLRHRDADSNLVSFNPIVAYAWEDAFGDDSATTATTTASSSMTTVSPSASSCRATLSASVSESEGGETIPPCARRISKICETNVHYLQRARRVKQKNTCAGKKRDGGVRTKASIRDAASPALLLLPDVPEPL